MRYRVSGTADIVIWDAAYRYLEVIDLKYGRIPVPVENNTQTRLYLMGALLMDD